MIRSYQHHGVLSCMMVQDISDIHDSFQENNPDAQSVRRPIRPFVRSGTLLTAVRPGRENMRRVRPCRVVQPGGGDFEKLHKILRFRQFEVDPRGTASWLVAGAHALTTWQGWAVVTQGDICAKRAIARARNPTPFGPG